MEVTEFQAYIEFAIIAVGVAAGYLCAIWMVTFAARLALRFRPSRASACRPGELVHQALKVSGRLWDHYRTRGSVVWRFVSAAREFWSRRVAGTPVDADQRTHPRGYRAAACLWHS